MPFKKGIAGNTTGNNGQPGRKVVTKVQKAIDKAIDLLGKNAVSKCGVTELAELICSKFKEDAVGTLKALAPLLPKDVSLDVHTSKSAQNLTDDELADIIANRARQRLIDARVIDAEVIEESDSNQDLREEGGV